MQRNKNVGKLETAVQFVQQVIPTRPPVITKATRHIIATLCRLFHPYTVLRLDTMRMTMAPPLESNYGSYHDYYAPHWKLYPRTYVVTRAPFSFVDKIDGDIDKSVWKSVPWSESFRDIQGGPNSDDDDDDDAFLPDDCEPPPPALTRFKALYDDDHLYIAAELRPWTEEGFRLPTEAHFTERNAPIYQRDSDFEVFVDCDGTNHNYKELEVNAINTVWNLLLDRPYADGGREHSGRVAVPGDDDYYEVYHQTTATRIVSGKINDPSGQGALWTVEMALAYSDLLFNTTATFSTTTATTTTPAPQKNASWRINFSRVERQGQINWTWQPQVRWDAATQQYRGIVDMHMPDAWGYLQFADDDDDDAAIMPSSTRMPDVIHPSSRMDRTWPAKLTAMTVYYALHHYRTTTGHYTTALSDLHVPAAIVEPFEIRIHLTTADQNNSNHSTRGDSGFVVTATSRINMDNSDDDRVAVTVRDDRRLTVTHRPRDTSTAK